MTEKTSKFPSLQSLILLSRLVIQPRDGDGASLPKVQELRADLLALSRAQFDDLLELAHLNHVVIRGMEVFMHLVQDSDPVRAQWAKDAWVEENSRINNAVAHLHEICAAFDQTGYPVTVIKSLDHLPDLGSDLDLFTTASPEQTQQLMKKRFNATTSARSWGDRLANKWNFETAGLPESVEIHVRRLGQTGEQVSIASSLMERTRTINVGDRAFRVTHKSDRILISVLQRMYRHFYFRLCDIIDSAGLVENDGVDFEDLRNVATRANIWHGTATYLMIVSDYVKTYRGYGISLPKFVTEAARFGGNDVYYARGFIRVPIMPQSAKLYSTQLVDVLRGGEIHNGARLSLLPWLATAALVGQKLTGSDKGIW